MARPNHRPRRNTPEQVDAAVSAMIREYEDTGDIAALHDFRLMERLNIRTTTLDNYYSGEADRQAAKDDPPEDDTADNNGVKEPGDNSIKQTYRGALKRLIAYRQLECVRHISSGGASTTITGWIFLSKQPHWGGFQDVQRQVNSGVQEFRVTISGPDGKPLNG